MKNQNIHTADVREFKPMFDQIQGLYDLPKSGYGKLTLAEMESYVAFVKGSGYPAEIANEIAKPVVKYLEFLGSLSSTGMLPASDNLGSFHTDNQGLIDRFYGPVFKVKEGEITLRVGNVFFPVQVLAGTKVKVGDLTGKIQFRDVEVGDDISLRASCVLRKDDLAFKVGVLIKKDFASTSAETIDLNLDDDASGITLIDVLAEAGSGSSRYVKLADLDITKAYLVTGVDDSGNPDYGRFRLLIKTDDGEKVLSLNKALKDQLEGYAEKLEAADAYTLDAMSSHFSGYHLEILEREMKGTRCFAKVKFTPKNSLKDWLEAKKNPSLQGEAKALVPATQTVDAEKTLDEIPF